jgi:hypothetical protein
MPRRRVNSVQVLLSTFARIARLLRHYSTRSFAFASVVGSTAFVHGVGAAGLECSRRGGCIFANVETSCVVTGALTCTLSLVQLPAGKCLTSAERRNSTRARAQVTSYEETILVFLVAVVFSHRPTAGTAPQQDSAQTLLLLHYSKHC